MVMGAGGVKLSGLKFSDMQISVFHKTPSLQTPGNEKYTCDEYWPEILHKNNGNDTG